jgi:hypothetical protein
MAREIDAVICDTDLRAFAESIRISIDAIIEEIQAARKRDDNGDLDEGTLLHQAIIQALGRMARIRNVLLEAERDGTPVPASFIGPLTTIANRKQRSIRDWIQAVA